IFMHFSSFLHINSKFSPNTSIDNIQIAFSKSDIYSYIYMTLKQQFPSIRMEDLYSIDYDLEQLASNSELVKMLQKQFFNYNDASTLITGLPKDLIHFETGTVIDVDIDEDTPELTFKPLNKTRPEIAYFDIPPYLIPKIRKDKIKKGDILNVAIYRFFTGAPTIILIQYRIVKSS
ncbi:MAG: hypothetical protein ACTSYY_09985, partial [Promethearchaeota archaeon]